MVEFLMGGMFFYILLPILESLMSGICTIIEVFKAKWNVKIAKYNHQISNIAEDSTVTRHPIGFQATSIEEEDENENEIL